MRFHTYMADNFDWPQWKVTDCIPLMKMACHDQWSLPEESSNTNLKRNSKAMCSSRQHPYPPPPHPPTEGFFFLKPHVPRNFHSWGFLKIPTSPLEFLFFLYPHFRTLRKFQIILSFKNWWLAELQSVLYLFYHIHTIQHFPVLLKIYLLLIWKTLYKMFDFFHQ